MTYSVVFSVYDSVTIRVSVCVNELENTNAAAFGCTNNPSVSGVDALDDSRLADNAFLLSIKNDSESVVPACVS